MDQQQHNSKSIIGTTVDSSQFLTRLVKIPIVHSAISVASGFYGKVKMSNGIVGKTLTVAENAAVSAAEQVIPLAQRFTPLAAQPLSKVDNLANIGLEKLEANVPGIMKEPQEIVTDTKELINSKVSPTVEKINGSIDFILNTKIVQFSMDCYESCLKTVSAIIDNILPPNETEKSQQNGFHSPKNGTNDDKTKRLAYLFHRSIYLIAVTTRRLLGLAQARVDSAVHTKDSVVNSARETINNLLPKSENQSNGEVKKASKHKEIKKNHNEQNLDKKSE